MTELGSIFGGPSFSVVDLSDCFLKPMKPLFLAHLSLASLVESENNHKITQPSENSKSLNVFHDSGIFLSSSLKVEILLFWLGL